LTREILDLKAAALLTGICILWGFNALSIKVSNVGLAPMFTVGMRSVIAGLCLMVWMRFRKMPLFPGRLFDGVMVGILFGVEFVFLYIALLHTTVSSAWILLYTSPFFHALGAHVFLEGDRLSVNKVLGLILAFVGIAILLSKHIGFPSPIQLLGDLLALSAAAIWAATTIYIKRRMVGGISHHHTLLYQTLFSIPILFLLSGLFEDDPVRQINGLILLALGYQSIIIAFISFLIWFYLVHAYPVSRLSAFTFLTPVFATLAGILLLHEPLTLRVVLALILVSIGIYVVNLK
jgi:drug/metabolite transporter (DMT)-like permease